MKINYIYQGDALKILKTFPDESVDMILTDPPYNAKNIGPNERKYSKGRMQLPDKEYKKFCKAWFKEARRISKTLIFTPGIANTHNYPQPNWIIAWHKPASKSFNHYQGFNAWEPIFCYGKWRGEQRLGQDYILCNTLNFNKGPERNHPCPKPLELYFKLIKYFSRPGHLVLDPMAGSGTTAVACRYLKRNFICIDKNKDYIKIINDRLSQKILL